MNELDLFECDLIDRFRQHPVFANITLLAERDFAEILLQRRFLSMFGFTPTYDLAIDLLQDEPGVRLARSILHEEYPDHDGHGNMPSHREDMRDDLFRLGISRRELIATRPTRPTRSAIVRPFELVTSSSQADHADLRILTILRFWGEVLVSIEYGELWKRMRPRLAVDGENCSRFYYPHHCHDAKRHEVGTGNILGTTHADKLERRLAALLVSNEAKKSFMQTEEECFQAKKEFYDQFVPMLA